MIGDDVFSSSTAQANFTNGILSITPANNCRKLGLYDATTAVWKFVRISVEYQVDDTYSYVIFNTGKHRINPRIFGINDESVDASYTITASLPPDTDVPSISIKNNMISFTLKEIVDRGSVFQNISLKISSAGKSQTTQIKFIFDTNVGFSYYIQDDAIFGTTTLARKNSYNEKRTPFYMVGNLLGDSDATITAYDQSIDKDTLSVQGAISLSVPVIYYDTPTNIATFVATSYGGDYKTIELVDDLMIDDVEAFTPLSKCSGFELNNKKLKIPSNTGQAVFMISETLYFIKSNSLRRVSFSETPADANLSITDAPFTQEDIDERSFPKFLTPVMTAITERRRSISSATKSQSTLVESQNPMSPQLPEPKLATAPSSPEEFQQTLLPSDIISSPVQSAPTPAQSAPAQLAPTPAQSALASTPVQSESAQPIQLTPASAQPIPAQSVPVRKSIQGTTSSMSSLSRLLKPQYRDSMDIVPVQATLAPAQTTLAPVQATLAPVQATLAPVQATLASVQAIPPVQASLAPAQTTPAPVQATLPPAQATPPVQTTPPYKNGQISYTKPLNILLPPKAKVAPTVSASTVASTVSASTVASTVAPTVSKSISSSIFDKLYQIRISMPNIKRLH